MAEVILPIVLVLTVTKTCAVVDAVLWPGGGLAAHAAQSFRSQRSQATAKSPVYSPRQRPKGPASSGASNVRRLHLRLLSMHVSCILSQVGSAAKYLLPVSDTSCVVTHRIMVAFVLLYDASLVLFLLAKTHVTNANRTLACWEKGVIWWSRLYAFIYLPFNAVVASFAFPGSASSGGEFCFNGFADSFEGGGTNENAGSLGVLNGLTIVQIVLLLLMFVKPMLVRVEGAQSGGAVYRRVVLRNVFCTIAIITSYSIMTAVVVIALLRESAEGNQSAQIRDVALAANSFGTLCLTEITLPLGFSSCMKACSAGDTEGSPTKTQAEGMAAKTGTAAARTNTKISTNTKFVVPLQELPPSTP